MNTFDKIKINIAGAINTALKKDAVKAADLVYPPKPEFGDLSLPGYRLAKLLNKSAVEAAGFLVGKVKTEEVASVKAAGPFLNFILNKSRLARLVIKEIEKGGKHPFF